MLFFKTTNANLKHVRRGGVINTRFNFLITYIWNTSLCRAPRIRRTFNLDSSSNQTLKFVILFSVGMEINTQIQNPSKQSSTRAVQKQKGKAPEASSRMNFLFQV